MLLFCLLYRRLPRSGEAHGINHLTLLAQICAQNFGLEAGCLKAMNNSHVSTEQCLRPCAQLLNEYSPIAAGMLAVLVPAFEPMGWGTREAGTLLGFEYTWPAIAAIAVSAVLGLLVSLSTFLVRAGLAALHGLSCQAGTWPCRISF